MRENWFHLLILGAMLAAPAGLSGAGFGVVIPIGGHVADIALDEARGVLYVANFTANRIDVMSLADRAIRTSMNVAPQPGSLAISANNQFLVIAHFGNWLPPETPTNAITLVNLVDNTRQTFSVGDVPLGVAFQNDGKALIVTSGGFVTLDPISGATESIATFANLAKVLPVPAGTFPAQINDTRIAASGNGAVIYGLASAGTGSILYRWEPARQELTAYPVQSTPALTPRVVSVSRDGAYFAAGFGVFDAQFRVVAQIANPPAANAGSHTIDSAAGLMYAQVAGQNPQSSSSTTPAPQTPAAPAASSPPVLAILEADNLTERERIVLPENLTGRAILSSDAGTIYAISDSGISILPVGAVNQHHRLNASQEDLVFRGNFCNRTVMSQDLAIGDPGGGSTEFTVISDTAGVTVVPASGITPAVVRVRVDPNVFQGQNGTTTATLTLRSASAVNVPRTVRVLVNNRNPDQRGTLFNIPGKLTDLLADPIRDRFYVLRQDRNQVLVFDANSYQQIGALRTAATPTQMAFTFDRKYLMVGHDNAQFIYVWDLDSFERQLNVQFPPGHYPRALADSGRLMLALSRTSGASGPWIGAAAITATGMLDRFDLFARRAAALPTLGIYANSVNPGAVLAPSPNGASVLMAAPDGQVMLYSSNADTFTLSRKDLSALSGAYAVSSYEQYVVGNNVLNSALVPMATLESASGAPSGFAFVDQAAIRSTSASAASPGTIVRMDTSKFAGAKPTRMVEAPTVAPTGGGFTRTLAPLSNRIGFVSLTTSGFTVLPWTYDAAVAPPQISKIVNAADFSQPVAPGGLVAIYGSQMSPVNQATKELPLPTALGESCLTVNGVAMPMLFVSSQQINGQLPFNVDGLATLTLRTPGGISDNFYFSILPAAPRIFRTGTAGPQTGLATVLRAVNNDYVTPTNPIHPMDQITIYATGLGRTSPAVDTGAPAPADPLPVAVIPAIVTLGGVGLDVKYAGLVPGEVGVYQINASVPLGVPLGMEIPLTVAQAGIETTLNVRVVK